MKTLLRRSWKLALAAGVVLYVTGPQATDQNVHNGIEIALTNPRVRLFSVDTGVPMYAPQAYCNPFGPDACPPRVLLGTKWEVLGFGASDR
jgi:hypothetical protein